MSGPARGYCWRRDSMHHSRAFRLFALCLLAGVALACFLTSAGPAAPPTKTASERSLYHADPEHLWNRLHEALFVRVGPDGRTAAPTVRGGDAAGHRGADR